MVKWFVNQDFNLISWKLKSSRSPKTNPERTLKLKPFRLGTHLGTISQEVFLNQLQNSAEFYVLKLRITHTANLIHDRWKPQEPRRLNYSEDSQSEDLKALFGSAKQNDYARCSGVFLKHAL